MIGSMRRAMQIRRLEAKREQLTLRRDSMIAALVEDRGAHRYRHEYVNTPVLEDVCLELDYVQAALAGYGVEAGAHEALV